AVKALARYCAHNPPARSARITRAIARACDVLGRRQLADGSYRGFWGINFTYATFFVSEALAAAGAPAGAATLRRAADWLIAHQRPDGGWGEHFSSCLDGKYREHQESQTVMTSWAVLALLEIVGPNVPAVQRGIRWLLEHRQADGSWPHDTVNGVFFGSAMLDY